METLAAQENCQCWNVPDSDGNTPVLKALKENKMDMLQILLKCPRVDLSCRDAEGWSLIFRAIAMNNLGKYILMQFSTFTRLHCRPGEQNISSDGSERHWEDIGPCCCRGRRGGGCEATGGCRDCGLE